jgi:hypothetical protein
MGIEFIGADDLAVQNYPTSFTVNYPAGVQPGDTVYVLIHKPEFYYPNYLPQINQWDIDIEHGVLTVVSRTIDSDTSEVFSLDGIYPSPHLAVITLAYRNLTKAFDPAIFYSEATYLGGYPSPGSMTHPYSSQPNVLNPTDQYLVLFKQSTRHSGGVGDTFSAPGEDPPTPRWGAYSIFNGHEIFFGVSDKLVTGTADTPEQDLTLSWELVGTNRIYNSLILIKHKHLVLPTPPGAPKLKLEKVQIEELPSFVHTRMV